MGATGFRDPVASRALGRRTLGDTTTTATTVSQDVGVVASIVSAVKGLFGGSSAPGGNTESAAAKAAANALPQLPTNASVAQQIAYKWYALYFGRPTNDPGIAYWTTQISQDGPQRAWVNFSGSSQPIAANVVGKAAQYQQLGYGDQYSPIPAGLALPSAIPGSTLPGTIAAPAQASILGGSLTPTTMLLGAVLLVAGVVLTKHGSKGRA